MLHVLARSLQQHGVWQRGTKFILDFSLRRRWQLRSLAGSNVNYPAGGALKEFPMALPIRAILRDCKAQRKIPTENVRRLQNAITTDRLIRCGHKINRSRQSKIILKQRGFIGMTYSVGREAVRR